MSVFDLRNWSEVSLRTFTLKHSGKEKWVYSGYGIAFDGKGEWSFGNAFARNVAIFSVDNTSSYHRDNFRNTILVLAS